MKSKQDTAYPADPEPILYNHAQKNKESYQKEGSLDIDLSV